MNFKDKVVLITGASYGIGREIATYFAKLGSKIIITYNKSRILSNDVVLSIKKEYNVQVDNIKCDITNEVDVNNLYLFVNNKYGKLDILINNAALSLDNYMFEKSKDEFMRVLEVNVFGTFLMMQKFSQITSYVFNISSTDAIDTGNEYNIDYSCSKASINCMTKYFSLFNQNTKYIALCPNWIETEPIKEMNQDFLQSELKRINQKKLINPKTIPIVIKKCIVENAESGSIIRIDGDINE